MKRTKSEIIGFIGSTVIHVIVLFILLFYGFSHIVPAKEEGIEVMFGVVADAGGSDETLYDKELSPEIPVTTPTPPAEPIKAEEKLLTQEEESVNLAAEKKEKEKQEEIRKQEELIRKEKAAKDALIAEEKQKTDAIKKKMSGAFKAGTATGNKGTTEGTGTQGSVFGNSDKGATEGVGGWGSFALNGRSLSGEGLPRPSYQIQEEGKIVVSIVVNPAGTVVSATIGRGTNLDNAQMRASALKAAKSAKFNSISGTNNQSGTITYNFNLK